jgi:hypothetical protein
MQHTKLEEYPNSDEVQRASLIQLHSWSTRLPPPKDEEQEAILDYIEHRLRILGGVST